MSSKPGGSGAANVTLQFDGKRPLRGELPKQSYDDIKKQCLKDKTLFEDPLFAATDGSIFFSRAPPKPFVWKRPREISSDAHFFVDGFSRFDVRQGELGDCWFLAAVASLSMNEKLFYRVVPPEQSFTKDYAGIFHFQFWQSGEWVDIVIDDRLPTFSNKLVFMHSVQSNEFWSALLEKAYAKLYGSYEALKGGNTVEAMTDFTGGVCELFELRTPPANLLAIMEKAFERNSLMGCSIEADPSRFEAELPNGLIMGHAYSVTCVKTVNIKTPRISGKIPLVRIRNPWGNEAEWRGAWSDKSPEWQFISDEEKKTLGIVFEHDGESWMAMQDFLKNFSKLEICNLSPDALTDEMIGSSEAAKKRWEMTVSHAQWVRKVSAGGCRNYLNTFWTNPQFRVTLTDPDDDGDDLCTCIIAVMQKDRRRKRKEGLEFLTMGFAIYKLPDPKSGPLELNFFKTSPSFARSPNFINLREVSGRFKLPPGTYVVIASTFEPDEEGDFLLRVFSEKKNEARIPVIDEKTGIQPVKPPKEITAADEAERENLAEFFKKIAGVDMEIDCFELRDILDFALKKEFKFDGFNIEVCRSMVAMMDKDCSGKLGFDEFKLLWDDIRLWKTIFKNFDHDRSGNLNTYELRSALNHAGIQLSANIFKCLAIRYGDKSGHINFDDFIMCAVRLKSMINTFRQQAPVGVKDAKASFDLDLFVQTTLYS